MNYITHRAPRGNIFAPHKSDRPIITAIPRGKLWGLKAISPSGEMVILSGVYRNRMAALGKAVLFAEQCGGQVVP